MNASALAYTAYRPTGTGAQTPRDVEYAALARVTGAMIAARDAATFPALASAVSDNTRLWTVLAVDAGSDENTLPAPLRAQIVSLALFAAKHGARVMAGEDDVAPLVDINNAIMKGLRGAAEDTP